MLTVAIPSVTEKATDEADVIFFQFVVFNTGAF